MIIVLQMKGHITEALSYTQKDRHLALTLEIVKRELGDADKELKWLRSAASSSEKEYEQLQRKLDEIQMERETERWYSFQPWLVFVVMHIQFAILQLDVG